jgi:hypothetical protein
MVDLMPLTGLIGTAQLEGEAEHTTSFVGSGRIAVLEHIIGTRSNFWGGHAARSTQMSIHAAARMSDSSLDRGLEAPDTTSRREAAGQRAGHRR